MSIAAIVIPVLGRPHRVGPTMESVAAATPQGHRLLFVASAGDDAEIAALTDAGADFITVDPARGSWACKANAAVGETREPWLFIGADDLNFHHDWLDRALSWSADAEGAPRFDVIGTNDLANPRVMTGEHSTHTLFRRTYVIERGTVDEPGKIFHEGYPHDYADDEAIETAKARGVFVHAFDSLVEHLHPMVDKAPDDETYRIGRAGSATGRRLFTVRRKLWRDGIKPRPAGLERATVVTASFGGVDAALHSQTAQDVPTDWLVYTDRPISVPAPWKVVVVEPRFEFGGMAAKVYKTTPPGTGDLIWIDASHQITSPSFVREALAARRDGIAAFAHPRRDCIYDEAEASLGAEGQNGKYADLPLMEQVAAYRAEGHPEHGGLWACGVVAWDLADARAREFGAAWLDECVRWSWQDQLSFPVVARRLGLNPGRFPVAQIERNGRGFLANRWLRIWAHTAPPAPPPPERHASTDSVSVLIPFASDDPDRIRAYDFILDRYATEHPSWEIVTEVGETGGPWSKGAALAALAARASGDVLVIADADSFIPTEFLIEAVDRAAADGWVTPHRTVYRLDPGHTASVLEGRPAVPAAKCCEQTRAPYTGVRGGGIVILTRDAWNTVGGIDPRFEGWGGEDIAFGWALETLVGRGLTLGAPLFHLWHPHAATANRHRASPESEALAVRYRQARRDPVAMRAIIAERAPVAV